MHASRPTAGAHLVAPATMAPVRRAAPMSFVFRLLARYRRALVAAFVWSLAFVLVPMQVPLHTGALVNGITGQPATFYSLLVVQDPGTVLAVSMLGLVAIAVAYGATAYLSTASVSELSRRFVHGLRTDLVRKLDLASVDVHERFGSGELMNRVLFDTQATREFVETVFFNTFQNVIRVAFPVAVLFLLDPWIGLAAASILPVQFLVTRHLQDRLHTATRAARTTQGRLTAAVKENLDGIETIQASHAEGVAIAGLARQSEQLAEDQIAAKVYSGLINGSTWALTSLGLALTWYLGGLAVLDRTMSLGTLVAITGFVVLMYTPMQRFTSVANVYQKGLVAFERIREVLDAPSRIRDDANAPPLVVSNGSIEFRRVGFAYAGRPVLTDVSFTVAPLGLTVVLGRNGSGKSTLLKLLDRLYDPSSGEVLIDGQDLRRVRLASLRRAVAVVPQRPVLFTGTLAENVRLGRPDATDEDVVEACRAAGALEFVLSTPQGFLTRIGTGGINVSGGEAQRLVIARAILRRPKILLLDEPNSALDADSEARLVATLQGLRGRMTMVVVAHHAGAMMPGIDRVVVMDGGSVTDTRPRAPRPTRAEDRPRLPHAFSAEA